MMGIIKNGVSWRAFKVSAIFALGFCTNNALTPNRKSLVEDAEKTQAETKTVMTETKSMREESISNMAEVKAMKIKFDNLLEEYDAGIIKVEEAKRLLRYQLQLYKARIEMEMKRDDGWSQEETEGPFI